MKKGLISFWQVTVSIDMDKVATKQKKKGWKSTFESDFRMRYIVTWKIIKYKYLS